MRILVTGSTGLVGSPLVEQLLAEGHEVIRLVRSPSSATGTIVLWDPKSRDLIRNEQLENLDVVIHLAGENIASRRWTPEQKARIRNSRVQGTGLLASSLAEQQHKPAVFLSASAIGYYGDQGDRILDEGSGVGDGFLPTVCRDWEAATEPAREAGIRIVLLRFGLILSPKGGALSKMLTPFQIGLGGVVGNGKQFMSWIDLSDVIAAIRHVIDTESMHGPVNIVAPNPVTNRDFTKTLGRILSRPTVLPMPAFAARLALGQMADELLLASARVLPKKLLDSPFRFEHPTLDDALRHVLDGAR